MGGQNLVRTSLYDEHVTLNANIVDFHGFELPIWYSNIKAEHLATRESSGLFDVSHMAQIELAGDGADDAARGREAAAPFRDEYGEAERSLRLKLLARLAQDKQQRFVDLGELVLALQAIVAQQLLPRQDGQGRAPAIEVLLRSPLVSELIRKGEVGEIKALMARSRDLGMQTFDQALFELYQRGDISQEVALVHADSANDLRLQIAYGDAESPQLARAADAAERNHDVHAGGSHGFMLSRRRRAVFWLLCLLLLLVAATARKW